MFGNSYADNFGLPTLEWSGIDANPFYGGLGGAQAPFVMDGGQPVPGTPGPAMAGNFGGGPADRSVPALQTANPFGLTGRGVPGPLGQGPLGVPALTSSAPDAAQIAASAPDVPRNVQLGRGGLPGDLLGQMIPGWGGGVRDISALKR